MDIRSYFDSIVRSALVGMIEKRVSDGSVLRRIGKWIKAGVIEGGRLLVSETGTGQEGTCGLTEAVREIRFDAAPGEDAAD